MGNSGASGRVTTHSQKGIQSQHPQLPTYTMSDADKTPLTEAEKKVGAALFLKRAKRNAKKKAQKQRRKSQKEAEANGVSLAEVVGAVADTGLKEKTEEKLLFI